MATDSINQLALHNISHSDFRLFQLITSPLIHGSILHLVMNSIALLVISRMIDEKKDEARRYKAFKNYKKTSGIRGRALIVLTFGTLASSISIALFSGSDVLTVGLSGGIIAVFGFVVTHWRYSTDQKFLMIDLAIIIGVGFIIPQISQIGHISGLISGIAMAFVFNVIDYFYMKNNSDSTPQDSLSSYIHKVSEHHVLTGLATYGKHFLKMIELSQIMTDPQKGFGMKHYRKEYDKIKELAPGLIEYADDIHNTTPLYVQ